MNETPDNLALADVAVVINDHDSVAVARRDLEAGLELAVPGGSITLAQPVPQGHKVAIRAVAKGQPVYKYGQVIGVATVPIEIGDYVHVDNVATPPALPDSVTVRTGADTDRARGDIERRTFAGIVRADGRVATRNYVGVLSSVNCSATVVKRIAATFAVPGALDEFPNVDGVLALTHSSGCALSVGGDGLEVLRRTLAGYARHVNIGAVLLVGLGCETNQVAPLADRFDLPESVPLSVMTIQDTGGARATVAEGVARIRELLPQVNDVSRVPVPASHLVLGTNCGGSDAWSGLTANPALGVAADLVVAQGGTAILGETPEIYGAEHLLTARSVNPAVTEKLLARIRWWEGHTAAAGASMDTNPSPGNKAGGITTIAEKSLGAVAKGGSSPLTAVYEYAEPVTEKGFVFMDTPGYDPVSVTGIVAGGANVVCFTTGRGSVFGAKPVPSLKLATNSGLYDRMSEDMDINCGVIMDGERSVAEVGAEIFERILAVASGEQTKSEEFGMGDEEFVPWVPDVML